MDKLIEAGNLLARGRVEHSYPHSWRSKAPIIFRNTPQWFIRMDQALESGKTLRETAVQAIADTAFHPDAGRNRIGSMVESRPDWLVSRQRAWGTPLAMFVDKDSGAPLMDEAVNARILAAIREGGADAWFSRPDADFLGDAYDAAQYEKVGDILDVWFDSGCTHAFTIEGRDDSAWPADLYLEGSDQHRGWFQSSLLEGCGTRGRAPYKAVLTHGFTQDENGEKMSKSKGNTVEPQTITKESGAEILRLWAAMVDYSEDQRIGKTILATTTDAYRKLRNTTRYLLGALAGFDEAERVTNYADFPPLEKFILHRLWELDGQVRAAYEAYRFSDVTRPLIEFCQGDLSTLFFDIRKDSLYCDAPTRSAPPGLSHGAGLCVRAPDHLAVAPDQLHHGRGVADALPRSRLQQPAGDAGDAGRVGKRRRGRALGQGRDGDVGGDRRPGSRTPRKAHRLGPGGRAGGPCRRRRSAVRLRRPGRRRGVPHQRRDPGRR
jgi:isoleucyl-tRNA synthetase